MKLLLSGWIAAAVISIGCGSDAPPTPQDVASNQRIQESKYEASVGHVAGDGETAMESLTAALDDLKVNNSLLSDAGWNLRRQKTQSQIHLVVEEIKDMQPAVPSSCEQSYVYMSKVAQDLSGAENELGQLVEGNEVHHVHQINDYLSTTAEDVKNARAAFPGAD